MAAGWLWTGVVHLPASVREIDPAAGGFGLGFIVHGLRRLGAGVIGSRPAFGARSRSYAAVGSLFIPYGVPINPAVATSLGHGPLATPAFRPAACTPTIVTFGLPLLTRSRTELATRHPGALAARRLRCLPGAILAGGTVAMLFWLFVLRFEAEQGLTRGQPGSELSAMIFGQYFPNPALLGTDAAAPAGNLRRASSDSPSPRSSACSRRSPRPAGTRRATSARAWWPGRSAGGRSPSPARRTAAGSTSSARSSAPR
jgi:hypothetical protein